MEEEMKELEKDFVDTVKLLTNSVNKNIIYEIRIGRAKEVYLRSLQEHNSRNIKMPDEMVKMFNLLEGNIK